MIKSGHESLSDTSFSGFIQTWAGQHYKRVNYLKIQKKFCFGVLTLQNLDGLLS